MRLIYTLGILIYGFAIWLFSFFNEKAKKWVSGRKNIFSELPSVDHQKIHWFHCASLGEYDMALPLIQQLKVKDSDIFVLVSFFSPSGMEHYKKRNVNIDLAVYLPLDTPGNARRFMEHFNPRFAYFVKYEFWANYILEAKKRGVKIISYCTVLRKNHRFFKWYGGFFRKILKSIDFFYVQNEISGLLLADIGLTNFKVVGDARFDRVIESKLKNVKNERIEAYLEGKKAFVVGSSWPKDEDIIIPYLKENPGFKTIIAPHDINEKHLQAIEMKLPGKTFRYSNGNTSGEIMILDTIGHLSGAYSYGLVAYVGGGFSGRLHNILEPAVFGLPVIFGPKFSRFQEASQFIQQGIAFSVKDKSEFYRVMDKICKNPEIFQERCSSFIEKNSGVSERILQHLQAKFDL